MNPRKIAGLVCIFVGVALVALAISNGWSQHIKGTMSTTTDSTPAMLASSTPLWQAEPLVPTAPPLTRPLAPDKTQPGQSSVGQTAQLESGPDNPLTRFGAGVPYPPLTADVAKTLGLGWYYSWRVEADPPKLAHTEFWQTIRVN